MAVGFGILGAGTISRHFVSALELIRGVKVVAVASRSDTKASGFASEFAIPRWYTDYQELVSDPRVDVVYVATPVGLHQAHSLMAIESGKAVLCEKPFATNADSALKVVSAAREHGIFCMEAMWMRFLPLMRELETRIARGDIGTVRALNANLAFPVPFSEGSRYYDAGLGGGALLDLGVYAVSLTSMLLGPPDSVQALQTSAPTGVDAQMTVTLEYPEALATLCCGFTGTGQNGAYVMGSEGYIEIEAPIYAPTTMSITRTGAAVPPKNGAQSRISRRLERIPAAVELRRRLGPRLKPVIRGNRERVTRHFRGFGYQFEAAEVVRCLEAGETESPIMPLDETISVMRILDAARESARRER